MVKWISSESICIFWATMPLSWPERASSRHAEGWVLNGAFADNDKDNHQNLSNTLKDFKPALKVLEPSKMVKLCFHFFARLALRSTDLQLSSAETKEIKAGKDGMFATRLKTCFRPAVLKPIYWHCCVLSLIQPRWKSLFDAKLAKANYPHFPLMSQNPGSLTSFTSAQAW